MKYIKQINLFLLVCVALLSVSGCTTEKTSNTVTGRWVVDFTSTDIQESDFETLCDDDYDFLHSFTLYEDGTYSANMFEYTSLYNDGRVINGAYNGNYAVVHDGTSIAFDETAYYQIEQDKDTLILHGEDDGTYVYRRNNDAEEIGTYRMMEVKKPNGEISNGNYIMELREDFGVGRLEDGEYSLNTGHTWRREDGKVVFMYDEELYSEGILVGNEFSLTTLDGRIFTYERISSNEIDGESGGL